MVSRALIVNALLVGCYAQGTSSTGAGHLQSIGMLGRGYNILSGNPLAPGGDPGFGGPVLGLTFNNNLRVAPDSLQIPDATNGFETHVCSTTFTSDEIQGTQSYSRELQTSVSADFAGWGAAFSASVEYQHVQQGTQSQDNVFMHSSASCSVYVIRANTFIPPKVTDNFVTGMTRLAQSPGANDWQGYYAFISAFGTHVMLGATFGGMWGQESEFSRSEWQKLTSSNLNIGLAASYSGLFSAGVTLDSGTQTTDSETFRAASHSQHVYSRGGSYSDDRTSWISSVRANPDPIRYELQPLDHVFDTLFMPQPHHLVDAAFLAALPGRRLALRTALRQYCSYLLNQSGLTSCAAPPADPVVVTAAPTVPPSPMSRWMPWADSHRPLGNPHHNNECPGNSYITRLQWSEQHGHGLVDVQATCSDGTSWRLIGNNDGRWNSLMECNTGFSRVQAQEQWGYGIINVRANCHGQGSCAAVQSPTQDCSQDPLGRDVTTADQCSAKGCCWTTSSQASRASICANEGETCRCSGTVYYGRRYVSGTPGDSASGTTTFEQTLSSSYRQMQVQSAVTCSNDRITGGDPLHGVSKHCFCVQSSCHFPEYTPSWHESNSNSNGAWEQYQACPWDMPVLVGLEVLEQKGYGIINYRAKCSNGNSLRRLMAWNTNVMV